MIPQASKASVQLSAGPCNEAQTVQGIYPPGLTPSRWCRIPFTSAASVRIAARQAGQPVGTATTSLYCGNAAQLQNSRAR